MTKHLKNLKLSLSLVFLFCSGTGTNAKAEISSSIGNATGTRINNSLTGICSTGLCNISGGVNTGNNKFHSFSNFDTRGEIKGVNIQTDGQRNLILGVTSNSGTYLNKNLILSKPANLFVLSPGGINLGDGVGFINTSNIHLSTKEELSFVESNYNIYNPIQSIHILKSDPVLNGYQNKYNIFSLSKRIEPTNPKISLNGIQISIDQSLFLDSPNGEINISQSEIKSLNDGSITFNANKTFIHGNTFLQAKELIFKKNNITFENEIHIPHGKLFIDESDSLYLRNKNLENIENKEIQSSARENDIYEDQEENHSQDIVYSQDLFMELNPVELTEVNQPIEVMEDHHAVEEIKPEDNGGREPGDYVEEIKPEDNGGREPEDNVEEIKPEDNGGRKPEDNGGRKPEDNGGREPGDYVEEIKPEDNGGREPEDNGGIKPEDLVEELNPDDRVGRRPEDLGEEIQAQNPLEEIKSEEDDEENEDEISETLRPISELPIDGLLDTSPIPFDPRNGGGDLNNQVNTNDELLIDRNINNMPGYEVIEDVQLAHYDLGIPSIGDINNLDNNRPMIQQYSYNSDFSNSDFSQANNRPQPKTFNNNNNNQNSLTSPLNNALNQESVESNFPNNQNVMDSGEDPSQKFVNNEDNSFNQKEIPSIGPDQNTSFQYSENFSPENISTLISEAFVDNKSNEIKNVDIGKFSNNEIETVALNLAPESFVSNGIEVEFSLDQGFGFAVPDDLLSSENFVFSQEPLSEKQTSPLFNKEIEPKTTALNREIFDSKDSTKINNSYQDTTNFITEGEIEGDNSSFSQADFDNTTVNSSTNNDEPDFQIDDNFASLETSNTENNKSDDSILSSQTTNAENANNDSDNISMSSSSENNENKNSELDNSISNSNKSENVEKAETRDNEIEGKSTNEDEISSSKPISRNSNEVQAIVIKPVSALKSLNKADIIATNTTIKALNLPQLKNISTPTPKQLQQGMQQAKLRFGLSNSYSKFSKTYRSLFKKDNNESWLIASSNNKIHTPFDITFSSDNSSELVFDRASYNPAVLHIQFTPANGKTSLKNKDAFIDLTLIPSEGEVEGRRVELSTVEFAKNLKSLYGMLSRQEELFIDNPDSPSRVIYDLLFKNIRPLLDKHKVTTILIAADRGLQAIPFAALSDGETFFGEKYAFSITPSLALTDLNISNEKVGSRLLALGASEFEGLAALPLVPQELQKIGQSDQKDILINSAFTPSALLVKAGNPSYNRVHVATHAEFRPGGPTSSKLHSGDGPISMDQLARLRKERKGIPMDLIVFSACRTALGDPDSELGFTGLALQAGAKSAVGTLWYVDDVVTSAFFIQMYRFLEEDIPKADALQLTRQAFQQGLVTVKGDSIIGLDGEALLTSLTTSQQRRVLNGLQNPYYWSGIELLGSPW